MILGTLETLMTGSAVSPDNINNDDDDDDDGGNADDGRRNMVRVVSQCCQLCSTDHMLS